MLQNKSPHMLLPSPARLGLSNAPSPPLATNPNPNKPSPPPPPSSSSSSSSGALLSLLPPLPRAQSLLQQMASLSTSLFEVSPNRALWSSSYRGNLPSFLNPTNSSSSIIPSTPSSSSSTKEIITHFSSLQTQLFAAVAELQEILDLQNSIETLSRHISASDSTLLSFANKIREAEHVLDRLVDDYSHHHHHSSTLDLDDLLSYAHRISYTTFAPPEHAAGLAPLRGALPPAPQDNEMRASQLYHFSDLDVGLPKKKPAAAAASSSDSKEENAAAAAAVADEVLMEPTPPREELPIQPPMLPITVPPGWKKGMPVDLPMDLPPVPPGWKPGDPVPLPPLALDGTLPGHRDEQKRLPIPPNAPEAIQVKYVQLDINPDEDEYSSDYSSEVGSSDEDDED
ncbi:putative mediator of RNA polymerase II transcription subunit 4 [Iris pallida]|uniref:Mediator of RNA polymerase II transcription subunit 4 n=1 Tax=Iris pallida TaxID=29817 RepID=A0AAX6FTP8_IRIPA|nr:putative mediator of RNA polymerase II transcription subunit 4 [Iris pallida]